MVFVITFDQGFKTTKTPGLQENKRQTSKLESNQFQVKMVKNLVTKLIL